MKNTRVMDRKDIIQGMRRTSPGYFFGKECIKPLIRNTLLFWLVFISLLILLIYLI